MANRALLVGIDQYPDPANNLNSCVADTLAFRQVLQTTYGFDAGSISLLHNGAATRAAVLDGLDRLFAGAQAGDSLVFLQSSHGWQYPEGDTMIEVLCCYDDFLKDTDLVARTQGLPPGVLTAVFDSCHSGGMNKVFMSRAAGMGVAQAKVWKPTRQQQQDAAQLYSQVTKFKFFGYKPTADPGTVVKSFQLGTRNTPPAKDFGAGPELNGAMFAACQADQTAAAGSPATDNLSAFTYAIVSELDTSVPLSTLAERVAERLSNLNMHQNPRAVAPAQQQGLLSRAFISGADASAQDGDDSSSDGSGGGFDAWEYLREQLGALSG